MDAQTKQSASAASVLAFPGGKAHADARMRPGTDHQLLLDTVINNMSQGVLMFDAQARLVFCNQRYIDMYGLSPDMVRPGSTLHELLEHRAAVGAFAGSPQDYIVELLEDVAAGKVSKGIVKSVDGRVFSIVRNPIPGGGWIATHEDITDRQRAEERIVHMARHDALTDLPNRTMMRERLEHELKRVKRGECLAVMCLDLDHFKSVNDTLGHPIGDELLKVVAERLRRCTREPDTIARLGGDEFAIIMTGMQEPTDAVALAKRIRDSITKPYHLDGHQIVADISIGISLAPIDASEPDQLLKNADMALYGAKGDGRGTYRFFEPEMDAKMKTRRKLEMDLRSALVNGEFELYYQPLVSLTTNEITTFEALVRWNHPVRGLISPADFIPVAEETGLIIPLGEWVLRRACQETAKWPEHIKVAVNLSPSQLKSRNLTQLVVSALAESGMAANRLQLEITETVLMHNTFNTLATLHQLRKLGVQIAMDDFGTGYAELPAQLPVRQDQDRSLVHPGSLERGRAARHCARRRGPRQEPQHDLDRGRCRDPAAAGYVAGGRLHRDAGLSVQPRAPGRRHRPPVPAAARAGGRELRHRRER
jgi:diguanylate cyclase (GGDEF)-like protein